MVESFLIGEGEAGLLGLMYGTVKSYNDLSWDRHLASAFNRQVIFFNMVFEARYIQMRELREGSTHLVIRRF